jgi:hypothetical protein
VESGLQAILTVKPAPGQPVTIEWRMKSGERQKAGDGHWKKHSEMDRAAAQACVPMYNYNSNFFEYRIRPERVKNNC